MEDKEKKELEEKSKKKQTSLYPFARTLPVRNTQEATAKTSLVTIHGQDDRNESMVQPPVLFSS